MPVTDIYFEKAYGELCTLAEEGEACEFAISKPYGKVTYLFLKRPVCINGETTGWFDIVSPYGYGGPVIQECTEGYKEQLVRDFGEEFDCYCKENKIVSEFIRFHPMIGNALDFKEIYEVIYSRKTVGTNLKAFDDPVAAECSKKCRKHIRQALNKGVTFKVTYRPDNLHEFKKIYYSTMERNVATEYYYFDDAYFDKCLNAFKDQILIVEAMFEGKTIAMNLCFVSNNWIHIHLSGTLSEYLYLSPAYILRYAVLQWGKEHDMQYVHHGGGRSSAEDDSLYLFKKQFGTQTEFDFYIGKKIRNAEVYEALCKQVGKPVESQYFPAYRA